MKELREMLDACRVGKKDSYNLLSLKGGKYQVPPHLYLKFLKTYTKAIRDFTPENCFSLAWQTKSQEFKPLTFDFDIIRATDDEIPNRTLIDLGEEMCGYLSNVCNAPILGCFMARKPVYEKEFEKTTCYKTGVHMYVVGVECTKRWALHHYRHLLEFIKIFCENNNVLNSPENVFDKSVQPMGANGMLLNCEFKPLSNKRYYIFFRANYLDGFFDTMLYTESQRFDTFEQNFGILYGFLTGYSNLKDPQVVKVDLESPQTKNTRLNMPIFRSSANLDFDFETFLKLTHKNIPGQTEYCRIIRLFSGTYSVPP